MAQESHALALPAVGKVLEALGLGAGVTALIDPTGASAAASATIPVVTAVLSHLDDRAEDRRRERMRLLLEDLRRRLDRLERVAEPPVDLFRELLSNAINDDDARKIPAQAAIIEWVAETRPDPALARLAASAVASLTYPELRSFVTWYHTHSRLKLERGFDEHTAWIRLHHAGLISQSSIVGKEFVTQIGKVLTERCRGFAYSEAEWQRLN